MVKGIATKDWYLIHTKPKQENIAVFNLNRQGYITYLPYFYLHKRIQGNYQQIREPMFARYLFIQLSNEVDSWGPIRSTRGVNNLVRFGGIAAKVPAELIKFLCKKERENRENLPSEPVLNIGDRVQVTDGIMQGCGGIISEKNSNKRVTLLLDIVGKGMRVEIPTSNINLT